MERVKKPAKAVATPPYSLRDDMLWNAEDIARYLGRTPRQVYYMVASGRLPVRRFGRGMAASKSSLAAFLRSTGGRLDR